MINRLRTLFGMSPYPELTENDPWPEDQPILDTTGVEAYHDGQSCIVRAKLVDQQLVIILRQIEGYLGEKFEAVYIARSPDKWGVKPTSCMRVIRERYIDGRGMERHWKYRKWRFGVINASDVIRRVDRIDWWKFEEHIDLPVVLAKHPHER
jgi:hypothetical protein